MLKLAVHTSGPKVLNKAYSASVHFPDVIRKDASNQDREAMTSAAAASTFAQWYSIIIQSFFL